MSFHLLSLILKIAKLHLKSGRPRILGEGGIIKYIHTIRVCAASLHSRGRGQSAPAAFLCIEKQYFCMHSLVPCLELYRLCLHKSSFHNSMLDEMTDKSKEQVTDSNFEIDWYISQLRWTLLFLS